ncbi:MAG: DUF4445 domain-containing protein, partial [Clostridia bacterium]|nr:DUF4445 domain-containing protein [Clostridia bacterium]
GGMGKCGKCTVTIERTGIRENVLSCKTAAEDGMTVYIQASNGEGIATDVEVVPDGEDGLGVAIDVGTTTVVIYFVDLSTGKTIKTESFLNPQRSYGADVVSRILYSTEHGTTQLKDALISSINRVLGGFLKKSDYKCVKKAMIAGNTVMLHCFVGEDISSFGAYPFEPVFLKRRELPGSDIGLLAECVVLLPSFSSFVGADIVCGGIATDIMKGNNILVDLGTNGEMLLSANGVLYSTSVAAGPAFEGADIECGVGGVEGAISSVTVKDGELTVKTVGNKPPVGICGAGLTDAIFAMISLGVIDETGAFLCDKGRFCLSDEVYITTDDVRKFQLAKSAVRSGIEVLLNVARIEKKDVEKIFICGGLGYYIDKNSAVAVGLIPVEFKDKIITPGNTAGIGAKMCLLSRKALADADALSIKANNVDLSSNPQFTEQFIENMFF